MPELASAGSSRPAYLWDYDLDEPRFRAILEGGAIGRLDQDWGKAAGLFPVDLARALLSATPADHSLIRWIEAPPVEEFLESLRKLGEGLLLLAERK